MKNFYRAVRYALRHQPPPLRTNAPEQYELAWDREAFEAFGIFLTNQQQQVLVHLPFELQIELVRTGMLAKIQKHLDSVSSNAAESTDLYREHQPPYPQ